MRRIGLFVLLSLLALPSTGQAIVRLTKEQAKKEPVNNVPQEIRGSFWAYPGKTGKITQQRLFGSTGPRANDVTQGELNNCFFVGTISEIAHVKPGKIAAMFPTDKHGQLKLDADGRVAVNMYRRTRGQLKSETVYVSAALVYRQGMKRPSFTKVANNKLWAPLLEKAYALMLAEHGKIKGLNAINQGGTVAQVIEAVTGERSTYRDVVPTQAGTEKVWRFLQAATAKKEIVVAGTPDERGLGARRTSLLREGVLAQQASKWTWKNQRMIGDHDQAVLGVREAKGQRYVQLRNPWSDFVPRGAGRNRGAYELPLEKFMLFFDSMTHSGKVQAGDG